MSRHGNVEMGIEVPDFTSNKDVYDALDTAAKYLEEKEIDVTDLAVTGLDPQPTLEEGGPFEENGQCLCKGVDLCGSAYCDEHGSGYNARHKRGEI